MPLVIPLLGKTPRWGEHCFIAENATLVGDISMGDACSIWFNTVLRGDVHAIRIGNNVNIQDGTIVHCTYKKYGVTIGDNVTIAHRCIIHGCTIGNHVMIGMGAIIMDNVTIGDHCIIGAGSVVLENTVIESGSIYAGYPAKKIKDVTEEQKINTIQRIATNYQLYASWYQ